MLRKSSRTKKTATKDTKKNKMRIFSTSKLDYLTDQLRNMDWSEITNSRDVESKNKSKAPWTLMRQHTQANMKRNTSILEEMDKQLGPEEILNSVNEFFLSQGTASKMINEPSKQTSEQICNSIVFLPTDAMEIERIILALRDVNSTGYDEIPVRLLKLVVHEIADNK
ncbi:hypothetical protein HHI36_017503 [Cryptolaemus montrouzieri]|uniref:Uncharacterized protein n=1 Tax=Cryptolaemus montrouzieri TaxID=559131 RepID=A0ABD2NNX3_9CUCU